MFIKPALGGRHSDGRGIISEKTGIPIGKSSLFHFLTFVGFDCFDTTQSDLIQLKICFN